MKILMKCLTCEPHFAHSDFAVKSAHSTKRYLQSRDWFADSCKLEWMMV